MSIVDEIKLRLDIVESVSGYASLQKAGRNFKTLCPFHTEKTPSFIVNPDRQSWRCFGACATGGDVISFVMRMENLDFGEALRILAQRTGVNLPERNYAHQTDSLQQINKAAANFYKEMLKTREGIRGMNYLQKRGVTAEAIAQFDLGISTNSWDSLKSHLLNQGFSERLSIEAGLVYQNAEKGNTWDFFRGRLMFPIHDGDGHVVGFGGRVLDDSSTPKYLNTAQTPIFNKRNTLYGLHLASDSIRTTSSCIVVEGYMDVIAAHEHGYTNVVASMGTALTEQQVSQLKSLAKSFVLALDPDTAGQEATLRSLESSWHILGYQKAIHRGNRSMGPLYQRNSLSLKIAALPQGRDPDQLIREDASEWERLTQEALPLMDYLIPSVAAKFDLSTGEGKAQAVEALFPIIAATENTFDQERYFRDLANTLDVSLEALNASILAIRRHQGPPTKKNANNTQMVNYQQLSTKSEHLIEDYTLSLILTQSELRELTRDFAPENFHRSENREVFTQLQTCFTIDALWGSLDESLHEHLAYLANRELTPSDRGRSEAALRQCLQRLERRHLLEQQEELLTSEDTGVPPSRDMEKEVVSLNARIKDLSSQKIR